MNISQNKPTDSFEHYKLFAYAWKKIHRYYGWNEDRNDHLFLPMYESIMSKFDPDKGTLSTYVFRGVYMTLKSRGRSEFAESQRKYMYKGMELSKTAPSHELTYLDKQLVGKLIQTAGLTTKEAQLLEEMFFNSMGSVEEARRNLGTPYSKARGGQVYTSLIQKLRKAYYRLEGRPC